MVADRLPRLMDMNAPLAGVKILDLTRILAGPLASVVLADLGADVVKVEPVRGGEVMRQIGGYRRNGFTAMFLSLNRGKRSLAVDLHDQRGQDLVRELADEADVVLENFRPGAADAMGLGAERLRAANPDLIYISISGYGPDGPSAGDPAYDAIIQGRSGMIARQVAKSGEPDLVQSFPIDKLAGLFAAQAVTSALYARATGAVRGQTVQVPMLDTALFYLWPDVLSDLALVGEGVTPAELPARKITLTRTKDGYLTYTVMSLRERIALARAVNKPELNDDPRFTTMAGHSNPDNSRAFLAAIADGFSVLTTADALERLRAEKVSAGPVVAPEDVLADPQVLATGMIVESEHPTAGGFRQARLPLYFDATPAESAARPAPRCGEHTVEVLAAAGVSAARIAELRAAGVIE